MPQNPPFILSIEIVVKLCIEWVAALSGAAEWRTEDSEVSMCRAAFEGRIEIIKLCKERGATDFDDAMCEAADGGHVEIVKLCREYGAENFDEAMGSAATNGHIEIVKLCREWGAADFDDAMGSAAFGGHIEIVKQCRGWGATDFDEAMASAARCRRIEIVKLCMSWLGYDSIHCDLLRHHHKREFFGRVRDELLPVAWHPDRFFDWCLDEGEKEFLEEMWRI